jgi:hypothetical protein
MGTFRPIPFHIAILSHTWMRSNRKLWTSPCCPTGMELEGSSLLVTNDQRAWVDGDLIRPLLSWNCVGMQIDTDSLLARDPLPSPLPEHRVRHPVGLLRHALLAAQRHADALPQTPQLPLRGLPHHVHVPTVPEGLHRLGRPSSTSSNGDGSYTARYRRSRFYCIGSLHILAGSLPSGFPDGL